MDTFSYWTRSILDRAETRTYHYSQPGNPAWCVLVKQSLSLRWCTLSAPVGELRASVPQPRARWLPTADAHSLEPERRSLCIFAT